MIKTGGGLKGPAPGILAYLKFFPCSYFSNYPNYSNCQMVFRIILSDSLIALSQLIFSLIAKIVFYAINEL